MIEKIIFHEPNENSSKFDYISRLPSIKEMGNEILFKAGLNIIVGPNGAGKTSIINALSHYLGASHNGFSSITKKWIHEIQWKKDGDKEIPVSPIQVIHDGHPIIYGDPRRSLGIDSSGFDEEFYGQGILESISMNKESSGEQSNRRITPFLEILQGNEKFPSGFSDHINIDNVNDLWKGRIQSVFENWLTGTIERGQPTVLLDEPESGLSMMNQTLLWDKILKSKAVSDKFQIILVSHSNQCLDLENANYIELKEGYLEACKNLSKGLISFDEAERFATNVQHQLSKRDINVLKLIKDSENGYPTTKTIKTCEKLLEIEFIQIYTVDAPPPPENESREDKMKRRFSSFQHDYVYAITAKGIQYLNLHTKK
jgi:predicted ATPase